MFRYTWWHSHKSIRRQLVATISSVDIDLTYIPLEDRQSSITHINEALQRIAAKVEKMLKGVRVIPRLDICRLTCEYHGCQVKIEVN